MAVFQAKDSEHNSRVALICWALWRARNEWVWNHKRPSSYYVLFEASKVLEQWIRAQDRNEVPAAKFLTDSMSSQVAKTEGGVSQSKCRRYSVSGS